MTLRNNLALDTDDESDVDAIHANVNYLINPALGLITEVLRRNQPNWTFRENSNLGPLEGKYVIDRSFDQKFIIFPNCMKTDKIDLSVFKIMLEAFSRIHQGRDDFPKITTPNEAAKRLWERACEEKGYPKNCVSLTANPRPGLRR